MKDKDENIKGKEAKNKTEKENLKPSDEKREKDIEEAKKELACQLGA